MTALLLLSGTPPVSNEVMQDGAVKTEAHLAASDPPPPVVLPPIEVIPVPDPEVTSTPEEKAAGESAASSDDILVTARGDAPPGDPLQGVNITSYTIVQSVDKAFVAPVAKGYQSIVPEPVRDGLGNALRNLSEPVNFLNFLLQFKIGKAAETFGRFAVNTTFGVAGLFDVAKTKPFNLPYRRNGFANTMGFYGVKPGPFLYLPLIGPTTLRDLAGNSIDLLVVPTAVGKPFDRPAYAIPTNIIRQLNDRIERDSEISRLQQESLDPYVEIRTLYLEMRQGEIEALKRGRYEKPIAHATEPATSLSVPLPFSTSSAAGEPAEVETPLSDSLSFTPASSVTPF